MDIKYSIIIPTYNRPKTLALALESVAKQTIPPQEYEIIICDDGSKPETARTALEFTKNHQQNIIRYFYHSNGGPAKARNTGIKHAWGEIIFFTDDDCIVPENWMEKLLDGYQRYPDVVGVGGWYAVTDGKNKSGYLYRYLEFIERYRNPDMLDTETETNIFDSNIAGNTANMSYRKEVLEKIEGFDENITFVGNVDWELKQNLQSRGYSLLYIPLVVTHLKKYTLAIFCKKFFNTGRGRLYMALKYPILRKNRIYNMTASNVIKDALIYALGEKSKFVWVHILSNLCVWLGRIDARSLFTSKKISNMRQEAVFDEWVIKKQEPSNNHTLITRIKIDPDGKPKPKSNQLHNNWFCSIIIPTYNRSDSLKKTLESLLVQTIAPSSYETIVVDDGSTDNTEETVELLKKMYPNHKIIYRYQRNRGPAAARNTGIREANGEVILFTDDDCIVPPNWLEAHLEGYKKYPDAVGIGGPIIPSPIISSIQKYLYRLSNTKDIEIFSNDPRLCVGNFSNNSANLSFRKQALERINGFNEEFQRPGSEDTDLVFRILKSGLPLAYLPIAVMHEKKMNLTDFIKFSFWRGFGFQIFREKNQIELQKIKLPSYLTAKISTSFLHSLLTKPQKFLTAVYFVGFSLGMLRAARPTEIVTEKQQATT